MYCPHEAFPTPPRETVIWHYFSLAKFLCLLNNSTLYFPRSDQFEDKMEGKMSVMDKKLYEKIARSVPEMIEKGINGCFYINCWVMSDEELYLMWNTYSSLNEDIAIKSTVGNLIDSLDVNDKRNIIISKVNYINYEDDDETGGFSNILAPHFCKRQYFKQENELRLVYYDYYIRPPHNILGINFAVSLNTLIDEIWISPKATKWYHDLVEKEIMLHGLSKKVLSSKLADTIA